MAKIGLITDLHISTKGNTFEIDTYLNFKNLLDSMKKWQLDHLIIAGDLCFQEPELEVYNTVKKELDAYGVPYSIIVGNHDEAKWIAQVFDLAEHYRQETNEIYYKKNILGHPFLFVDTQKGSVSETQIEWLISSIDKDRDKKPNIIMHYPPVFGGVPHMDNNYFLKNKDQFLDAIKKLNIPLNIFTGHFHVEKSINTGNINVFITPSAFVQIDQQSEPFKADHHQVAYRIIDFEQDLLLTSVHYLF